MELVKKVEPCRVREFLTDHAAAERILAAEEAERKAFDELEMAKGRFVLATTTSRLERAEALSRAGLSPTLGWAVEVKEEEEGERDAFFVHAPPPQSQSQSQ